MRFLLSRMVVIVDVVVGIIIYNNDEVMGLVVSERPVEDEFGKNHPHPSLRPTSPPLFLGPARSCLYCRVTGNCSRLF